MAIDRAQFDKLIDEGFTVEEIAEFDKRSSAETQEQPAQAPQPTQNPGILDRLFNIPAAAQRSALQGTGYGFGASNPEQVPTFEGMATQASDQAGLGFLQSPIAKAFMPPGLDINPNLAVEAGKFADFATNPAQILSALVGAKPTAGVAQGVAAVSPKAASAVKKIVKFDNVLTQAKKAQIALDTQRKVIGEATDLAIQDIKDVPAELNWGLNKSQKIVDAIKNPIYEVEFTETGGVVNTIGNLRKVKEAVGQIFTPKIFQETVKKEQELVLKFYGEVNKAMKSAAKKAGKPIDEALDNYDKFMDNFRKIQHTIEEKSGEAMGNKLLAAFKFKAEPAYKEAWKEVSKTSPEIKEIMNSRKNREVLKIILKYAGGGAILASSGKGIVDVFSGK